MSTKSGALPIERRFLRRAWLVVVGVAVALAVALILAIALAGSNEAGTTGTKAPGTSQDVKVGQPASRPHGPIMVNGNVCGQCA